MTAKEHIEEIIKATFIVIKKVYKNNQKEDDNGCGSFCKSNSRIVFPRYRVKSNSGETRISEQELRFIFIEQFYKHCQDKQWNAYYSVETPTENKYVFSENNKKILPRKAEEDKKEGQSAMVDLCIYDEKLNRIALIEFKALNPDKHAFDKDLFKLKEERIALTFFIMIVKSHGNGTITNIHKKIETKGDGTEFYCYDLENEEDISKKIIEGISTSEK